jgi:hypothetical protein
MRRPRSAVPLLTLVLLAACAREPREAVLGEWRSGGERMEFLADGRVLLKHVDGSVTIASWEFPEKRVMRMQGLAAAPTDYAVTLRRDSLALCKTAAPADCYRFARMRGER